MLNTDYYRITNILKSIRYSGIFPKVIFFFSNIKKLSVALATVSVLKVDKGKKNKIKNRKTSWFEYVGYYFKKMNDLPSFVSSANSAMVRSVNSRSKESRQGAAT